MAVLSDNDRFDIWQEFMSDTSRVWEAIGTTMTKAQLRAVVDAIDIWIDDNQVSFNNSLPEPGKTQLTQKQKVKIFMAVAERRWEVT